MMIFHLNTWGNQTSETLHQGTRVSCRWAWIVNSIWCVIASEKRLGGSWLAPTLCQLPFHPCRDWAQVHASRVRLRGQPAHSTASCSSTHSYNIGNSARWWRCTACIRHFMGFTPSNPGLGSENFTFTTPLSRATDVLSHLNNWAIVGWGA